ncbi:type IV pilus assembly protein PilA [Natranaerovirga hydrolytica]|uniref:Type IV pilus assembly protein PilA n=1 Tax=Natranaerovirga hydrolytica TaxID=680378 RepID=A0A4R1MYK0_9FIRM|nr:prepilin-type N-terminal cleavage/methylation domain-containing protein [Natranaerovirga hydrolytica]TCK98378.1 type IV pilus assembly protein PilA [Natranaerovirga hydrolytica]
MKNIKKFLKNQKGFSLVELIIVIAILLIIAGIAAPNLIRNVESSRKSTDVSNARTIANAIGTAIANNGLDEYSGAIGSSNSFDFESGANNLADDAIEYLQNAPTIQWGHSGADREDEFHVTVDSDGTITIESGTLEVYPNPANVYTN